MAPIRTFKFYIHVHVHYMFGMFLQLDGLILAKSKIIEVVSSHLH